MAEHPTRGATDKGALSSVGDAQEKRGHLHISPDMRPEFRELEEAPEELNLNQWRRCIASDVR